MIYFLLLLLNTLISNASIFPENLNYQRQVLEKMTYQEYFEDFQQLEKLSKKFLLQGQNIIADYQQSHLAYLHLGHELAVNKWFYEFFQIFQEMELFKYHFGENFPLEKEQFFYFVNRLRAHFLGNFLLKVASNYDIYRYLEEGDLYLKYEVNSFTKLEQQYWRLKEKCRNPPPITSEWQNVAQGLYQIVNQWHWWGNSERRKISQIKDHRPYNLFLRAGGHVVATFTEMLSKREDSFSLRFWTNFRENYLRTNIQQVEQILVRELGLHPGDILAEKDLQSNTDLFIPGYWGHNGVYLGTIEFFRRMNLWPHRYFRKIRENILSYQVDRVKRQRMAKLDLLSVDFEQVHWVMEANRDGVKVIPLRQFFSVDGLALMRANRPWDPPAYKDLFFRANYFMGKSYDHTHDVRNKRGMTCSKFIALLYSEVTFPVSQFFHYLVMGPDQIISAIDRDFNHRNQGHLKLLAFFDAYDGGRLKYHYHYLAIPEGYQQFIDTLPPDDLQN